jgi:hypothetical protein
VTGSRQDAEDVPANDFPKTGSAHRGADGELKLETFPAL